jgi:hypothetical protein
MRRLGSVSMMVLVALAFVAVTSVSYAGDATIYAVHGIPDLAVDVSVDGECVAENVMYGDQVGPVMYAPGTYLVKVSAADPMDPCMGMVLAQAPLPVIADEDVTVVIHLDEMGAPTASKFYNELSRPDPGKARVIAHHCAAAPPVDIAVSRDMDVPFEPAIVGIANGEQVTEDYRPGEWYVSIAPTGTTDVVYGPTLVHLKPFMVYRVFAVGSPLDGSLTVFVFETDAR